MTYSIIYIMNGIAYTLETGLSFAKALSHRSKWEKVNPGNYNFVIKKEV